MNRFRTIVSASFAFLVLFASSNFMVGIHFCSGEIQNVALFGKAEKCANEKKLPPCHLQQAMPCCQDETIVHDAQAFKDNVEPIDVVNHLVVDVAHPPVLLNEIVSSETIFHNQFYNYDPPFRSSDRTVALHVFLI